MLGYIIYMIFIAIIFLPIVITPFIVENEILFNFFHDVYSYTCHQKIERSFCLYNNFSFGNCIKENESIKGREIRILEINGERRVKFPVCARDFSLYLSMFISGLIYPFLRSTNEKKLPPIIFLVLALIPIGLDGLTQLIGLRESNNLLRFITGFIAGFALPFYIIPSLNIIIYGKNG